MNTELHPADGGTRRPLRSALRSGYVVAVLCWVAAWWWLARDDAADLPPLFLALAAGMLCAVSFTNRLHRIERARTRWVVHSTVVGALAVALASIEVFDAWSFLFSGRPAFVSGTIFFVFMAALPFGAWSAVALLGQLIFTIGDRRPAQVVSAPAWSGERGEYVLTIDALNTRLSTALIGFGGGAVIAVAAYFGVLFGLVRLGIGFGPGTLVLSAPAFVLVLSASQWTIRSRMHPHTMRIAGSVIELRGDGMMMRSTPLPQVRAVRLRSQGITARIECETTVGPLTLLVGPGRAPLWTKPDGPLIPTFPAGLVQLLERNGLLAEATSTPERMRFSRALPQRMRDQRPSRGSSSKSSSSSESSSSSSSSSSSESSSSDSSSSS
ncbi:MULTISPECIES: hypothetical protein [unclassified Plantibacter]|uniref:hypothetical protein n=1 Tax=unclassified Plantibacter TaxID=2624265 RepID=UPI003D34845C